MTPDDLRGSFRWLRMTERSDERMIGMIPDESWDFAPAAGARTVAELITHLYGSEIPTLEAFVAGRMTQAEFEAAHPAAATSRDEALQLMRRAQERRDEVLAGLTQEQMERPVELFYGTFPGAVVLGFLYDEHWHHRGQLTVYLRALGVEPPFLYDIEASDMAVS